MSRWAKESLSHRRRVAAVKDNVPEGIGDPVAPGHSLRTVVVKMCLLDVLEISIFEVVVVLTMVDPFFKHIALNDSPQ